MRTVNGHLFAVKQRLDGGRDGQATLHPPIHIRPLPADRLPLSRRVTSTETQTSPSIRHHVQRGNIRGQQDRLANPAFDTYEPSPIDEVAAAAAASATNGEASDPG
jgi:hypothetical protein